VEEKKASFQEALRAVAAEAKLAKGMQAKVMQVLKR
jgi:hypothetical protein